MCVFSTSLALQSVFKVLKNRKSPSTEDQSEITSTVFTTTLYYQNWGIMIALSNISNVRAFTVYHGDWFVMVSGIVQGELKSSTANIKNVQECSSVKSQ